MTKSKQFNVVLSSSKFRCNRNIDIVHVESQHFEFRNLNAWGNGQWRKPSQKF